jgi:hypothetical protein
VEKLLNRLGVGVLSPSSRIQTLHAASGGNTTMTYFGAYLAVRPKPPLPYCAICSVFAWYFLQSAEHKLFEQGEERFNGGKNSDYENIRYRLL